MSAVESVLVAALGPGGLLVLITLVLRRVWDRQDTRDRAAAEAAPAVVIEASESSSRATEHATSLSLEAAALVKELAAQHTELERLEAERAECRAMREQAYLQVERLEEHIERGWGPPPPSRPPGWPPRRPLGEPRD